MMNPLEYYYLLSIGIILIGLEALVFSFFLMWIGIGFLIVGIASFFITFGSAWVQLAIAFSIGLVLVVFFRKKIVMRFSQSDSFEEEAVHKEGIGVVTNGVIEMDGTFWQTHSDLSSYKDGDKVKVKIEHNIAIVL